MRAVNAFAPDQLTPNETESFSMFNISNERVAAHYLGLSDELRTGIRHECGLCMPVHVICCECKAEIKTTWGAARTAGWVFDVDGLDFCPTDDPYQPNRTTGKEERFEAVQF